MEINKTRKEELKKMTYGDLQRQPEFKEYLSEVVYNKSHNMTTEVEFMLKASIEDSDSPLDYEDVPSFYYDEDELIDAILEDFNELEDEKEDFLKYVGVNYEHQLKEYLKTMDSDELVEFIDHKVDHYLSITSSDYERELEIYQWFLMDDRLLYQLEQRGEVVLNDEYWGRQCCGQAIEMDGVIIEIFKEWWLR